MQLDWIVGKTIQATQVERNGTDLELWFKLYNECNCFIMTLLCPGDLDWIEVDGLMLEETHNRQVVRVETLLVKDAHGCDHYTYRLHFTDGAWIDIFADTRVDHGTYLIREALYFRIEDPNEEPWDGAESKSILSELESETERLHREREAREAGMLDPQIVAQYVSRF